MELPPRSPLLLPLDIACNSLNNLSQNEWNIKRKNVNGYDFNKMTLNYQPINRAFFKMWEMLNKFRLSDFTTNYNINEDECKIEMSSLHLAEAPGAFIEALCKYNSRFKPKYIKDKRGWVFRNIEWNYLTMSLTCGIKYKQKKFLKCNKITILDGVDGTGNIHNLNNVQYIYDKNKRQKFNLITADGGFNENQMYDQKELLHFTLIRDSILTAIPLLKLGGNFVLKIFNMRNILTIRLLYVYTSMFEKVHIYKPKTSRPTNSEKYIICQNLLHEVDVSLESIQSLKFLLMTATVPFHFIQMILSINMQSELLQTEYIKMALKSTKKCKNQWNDWCNEFNYIDKKV